MTRPLHKDTRVQRGRSADHRAQERRDASPWRVVSVVAAFLSLIPIGLGVAALVANSWRGDHHPSAGAAARADRQPPAPRLLADPERARLRLEAEAEGATIRDLHVWRIGPHAHAAILSLAPGADGAAVRARIKALPRMEHVTVECR